MVPETELRAEWLANRRSHITASDAAKILGISPYGTAISVYRDKLGIDEPDQDTPEKRRGRRRERNVLEAYEDIHGPVRRWAPFTLVVSPSDPLFACTPDAERADNGNPVEAKSVRVKTSAWGESGTDFFPEHFAVQMALQMHCLDKPLCHLPVEFAASDDDFANYVLPRNPAAEVKLLDLLHEWWQTHIVHQVAPTPDGSKSFTDYVKATWPRANRGLVYEASEAQNQRGGALLELKEEIARLEMQEAKLAQEFQVELADASELQGNRFYILWRTSKDSVKTNWEKVARQYAEEIGFHVPLARPLQEYVTAHTRTSPGARPFLFKAR